MKRRLNNFEQMKAGLVQRNTRFADGKIWLEKVDLVSDYESDVDNDDDKTVSRLRPLYQSNLVCLLFLYMIHFYYIIKARYITYQQFYYTYI